MMDLRPLFLISLLGFLALGLSWGSVGHSSEVDQETYSNLPLRDAAPELNRQITLKVQNILNEINHEIAPKNPKSFTDSELEFLFASQWKKQLSSPWTSEFEECIPRNNCSNWYAIDRINLKNGESVYDESELNFITSRYITSIISACNVRFGVDKLTHMFQDGFRYYDMWMDRNQKLSDLKILQMGLMDENHIMGRSLTSVVSYGDVYANLAGVDFFRSLFVNAATFKRDSKGLLVIREPINICNFINPFFDERVSKVEYYGSNAEALQKVINHRRKHLETINPEITREVLARPQTRSVGALEIVLGIWALVGHPQMTAEIYDHFPKTLTPLENRRTIDLSRPKALPESYVENFVEVCHENGASISYCECVLQTLQQKLSAQDLIQWDRQVVRGESFAAINPILDLAKKNCHQAEQENLNKRSDF